MYTTTVRVPSVSAMSAAQAAVLGCLDPGGVVVDGFEGFFGDVVAVQPGGEQVVEPGVGDRVDVVC